MTNRVCATPSRPYLETQGFDVTTASDGDQRLGASPGAAADLVTSLT